MREEDGEENKMEFVVGETLGVLGIIVMDTWIRELRDVAGEGRRVGGGVERKRRGEGRGRGTRLTSYPNTTSTPYRKAQDISVIARS